MPVVKLNNIINPTGSSGLYDGSDVPTGGYLMAADSTTSDLLQTGGAPLAGVKGFLSYNGGNVIKTGNAICVDQGLDSNDLSVQILSPSDPRYESQYMVEVDNRLFDICSPEGNGVSATPSFIDDDQIATYMFMENTSSQYFATTQGRGSIEKFGLGDNVNQTNSTTVIGSTALGTGRYGTRFGFILKASLDIQNSTALFNQIGSATTQGYGTSPAATFNVINTVVRITGYTTGYRMDIPIKVLKKSN